METIANPSDQELTALKEQLEAAKRKAEYERLKQNLKEMTHQAAHMPTGFDGAMQLPDTEKVMQTKRKGGAFIELLFSRLQSMFSLRPIVGHVIALLIAMLVLFYIFNKLDGSGLGQYKGYFSLGIQFCAAVTIIKSASRGLLLPFLALIIGGAVVHSLGVHQMLWHFDRAFYEHLMITGMVGLGVAVLSID